MARETIAACMRAGRTRALLAVTAGLTLLAGCASTPREINQDPQQPQAAAQPAPHHAAPANDAASTPAPVAAQPPAVAQEDSPAPAQPTVAQPAKLPAVDPEPAQPDFSKMTEEEIIEQIKAAVLEAQKAQLADEAQPGTPPAPPTTQPSKPAPASKTPPTPPATKQPVTVTPPGSQPTTKPADCHGNPSTQALTPPPEGSPQPKAVCREPKISLGTVWKGKPVVASFEIANEGEAPLQIRLQGG